MLPATPVLGFFEEVFERETNESRLRFVATFRDLLKVRDEFGGNASRENGERRKVRASAAAKTALLRGRLEGALFRFLP